MGRRGVVIALSAVVVTLASACVDDFVSDGYVTTDPDKGCPANGKCRMTCGSSPCDATCGAGSDCIVECGSGICEPSCNARATCSIVCGSGLCQPSCEGTCTIQKGSGTVQCSGSGCPR